MLKHIFRSKLDIENLSHLKTRVWESADDFDYKYVVVNKPWGYEYLVFENAYVAIWILYIKKNQATSMHCHPNKKTSLVVLSGNVNCKTLEGWVKRNEGEGLFIEDGVFHSTKALSKEGAFVIEIESPPNKRDLVRLKDRYGRKEKGYEGISEMSNKLENYEYLDFHSKSFRQESKKRLRNCDLSIAFHDGSSNIENIFRKKGGIICLLQGKILDAKGNAILSAGETVLLDNFQLDSKTKVTENLMYLNIYHGKKS